MEYNKLTDQQKQFTKDYDSNKRIITNMAK